MNNYMCNYSYAVLSCGFPTNHAEICVKVTALWYNEQRYQSLNSSLLLAWHILNTTPTIWRDNFLKVTYLYGCCPRAMYEQASTRCLKTIRKLFLGCQNKLPKFYSETLYNIPKRWGLACPYTTATVNLSQRAWGLRTSPQSTSQLCSVTNQNSWS